MYVAVNSVMRGGDLKTLPPYLEYLQEIGADAVIVSDLGALALSKKYAPALKLHVSTQAGVANAESARMLFELGAARIVLARELTLDEITTLRADTPPELELEAFIHGSMCVSFSGRCLLSSYLTGRDANAGECAQPCRWKYHLVEEKRPGEYLEITEDGGTFILNSRDMCMIRHIPALLSAGIDSLKIEGRQKSFYYTAVVTNAYRHAVDAALRGEALSEDWASEVLKVSHRPYSTGFFFNSGGPGQFYEDGMYFSDADVVAVVADCDENGSAVLTQRNKFTVGDALELLMPGQLPTAFTVSALQDNEGNIIDSTPHPMMVFRMKLPAAAPQYSVVRKIRGR
jgi:putative protease